MVYVNMLVILIAFKPVLLLISRARVVSDLHSFDSHHIFSPFCRRVFCVSVLLWRGKIVPKRSGMGLEMLRRGMETPRGIYEASEKTQVNKATPSIIDGNSFGLGVMSIDLRKDILRITLSVTHNLHQINKSIVCATCTRRAK